jgi:hypothetical protein
LSKDTELGSFADEHGISVASARMLFDALRVQTGAKSFYVFWTAGAGAGASGGGRQRTLLAFTTPDSALAFAQRNQLGSAGEQPRLRRLSLLQLVQAMLREPAITALLVADEGADQPTPAGRLPAGTRIERADVLRRLQEHD